MNVSVDQVERIIALFRDDADILSDEVARKADVPEIVVDIVFDYGHLPSEKLARAFSLIGPRTSPEKVGSIMRRISPQSWDWDWGTGK